jgi:hypothetical protein
LKEGGIRLLELGFLTAFLLGAAFLSFFVALLLELLFELLIFVSFESIYDVLFTFRIALKPISNCMETMLLSPEKSVPMPFQDYFNAVRKASCVYRQRCNLIISLLIGKGSFLDENTECKERGLVVWKLVDGLSLHYFVGENPARHTEMAMELWGDYVCPRSSTAHTGALENIPSCRCIYRFEFYIQVSLR